MDFKKIALKVLQFFKKNKKIFIFASILLIIFLSLFPRAVDVLNVNPIFGFDQGRDYLAVKNIVVDHKPTLIGAELGAGSAGISGIFQGPFYYYFLSIPFLLSGGNPVTGVAMMLAFSLASICLGYYLGKKMFGGGFGLLTAFLMAISPILIGQARFIWNPHMPTFFILLTLIFFYLFLIKKKNYFIFLFSFFAGFIYNFESAVAIPLSACLVIYSLVLFRRKIINYLFLFGGFLFSITPMILFEIRHSFIGLKGLISYLTANHSTSSSSLNQSFAIDHVKSIVFNFKDTFPIDNFNLGLLFLILLLGISVYFLMSEKRKELKYFFWFPIFLIPITLFIFSFLKNALWSYYLTDLNISYILLFTYILYSIMHRKLYKMLTISLIFIFILGIIGAYNSIKVSLYDYKDYGGTAKLKGKVDAIDFIYADARSKNFGVLVFSPPIYTYPYDYLFWWHGQRKYGYIPYSEKKGTFYLLMEPDPQKPWTYKGWMETVVKTGKIEWTKKLPSGFIVQKRIET